MLIHTSLSPLFILIKHAGTYPSIARKQIRRARTSLDKADQVARKHRIGAADENSAAIVRSRIADINKSHREQHDKSPLLSRCDANQQRC